MNIRKNDKVVVLSLIHIWRNMGQKVNPHGLRVGVIKDWDSRWYARNDKVGDLIVEDYKIRKFLKKTLYSAGVPTIEKMCIRDRSPSSAFTAPNPAAERENTPPGKPVSAFRGVQTSRAYLSQAFMIVVQPRWTLRGMFRP